MLDSTTEDILLSLIQCLIGFMILDKHLICLKLSFLFVNYG